MNTNNQNRANDDGKYPGYPHYPAKEDITQPTNHTDKLNVSGDGSINLPDVNDIPGQQNIKAAPLGQLADITPSSADEEDIVNGDSLDATEDDLGIVMGTDADVTREDLQNLGSIDRDMDLNEDEDQNALGLDNTDEDGDPLNEQSGELSTMGSDLDVPGSEQDDANEAIGEEDEENNYYSQSDNQDDTQGIP